VDPTGGALFYYNPSLATDRWIRTRPVIKVIGNHTFSS
jgi:N-acetylmuramoyl-L-alanine amidase